MSRSDSFEGFVLAGGKSSRMGTDKAFLKIGDRTFIENAIEALRPNCRRVRVVLNKGQTQFINRIPAVVTAVFDIYENRGALGGIHAALSNCDTEFAIILACDMPFVTGGSLACIADEALSKKTAAAWIPVQKSGRIQPLCGIYKTEICLRVLEKLIIDDTSISVKSFLSLIKTEYVREVTLNSNSKLFWNINTVNGYEKISQ